MKGESSMLTKEEILKGTKLTKKVHIKGLGGEIEIRPLNEEQWAEIESRQGDLIDFEPVIKDGKMDRDSTQKSLKVNTKNLFRTEFEQNILTCKYGMVMDITEEELRRISPPGIIKQIAAEILKLSGVTEEGLKEIQSFRKDKSGN